jgi:hypothetical protein
MAGDVGFDPLGLSQINDVGIDLYWLREAELKHCRLAMLAVAGILFCETVGPLPGFVSAVLRLVWLVVVGVCGCGWVGGWVGMCGAVWCVGVGVGVCAPPCLFFCVWM